MAQHDSKDIVSDFHRPKPVDLALKLKSKHYAWCYLCGQPFDMTGKTDAEAEEIMEEHSLKDHKDSKYSLLDTVDAVKIDTWKADPRQRRWEITRVG